MLSSELALLTRLQTWSENQARQYVGHVITTTTITSEYHRADDISGGDGHLSSLEGSRCGAAIWDDRSAHANILQLGNGFVRSVSDVREDMGANFGQGASDFASGTALTSGVDYCLDLDVPGLSKSGRLLRVHRPWSSRPGTIRVTYVAGLTAAELDAEYSFVKLALLEDMQAKFTSVLSQRGGQGTIKKQAWAGDYSVEFSTNEAGSLSALSAAAMSRLGPIRRIAL